VLLLLFLHITTITITTTITISGALHERRCKFDAPATLLPWEQPQCPSSRRLGGPQSSCGHFREEKNQTVKEVSVSSVTYMFSLPATTNFTKQNKKLSAKQNALDFRAGERERGGEAVWF
jgi:hypothetical protein